jgi:NADP-dependent aldehyde dehydrogenase
MFILPSAAESRADVLGEGWAGSLTMGAGQFCTNPGVTVIVKGTAAERMEASCVAVLKNTAEQKMLTDGIHKAYEDGVRLFADLMENISNCGTAISRRSSLPTLFKVSAQQWMENLTLQHEVFGAVGILVICDDVNEMQSVAECLEGQLTATLHLDDLDHDLAGNLLPILEEKAGRVLCNGFPTGVEVCSSMMHGGPYPASTDVRATSVGTLAIVRWLRPISYQNVPKALLPDELQ